METRDGLLLCALSGVQKCKKPVWNFGVIKDKNTFTNFKSLLSRVYTCARGKTLKFFVNQQTQATVHIFILCHVTVR